jgi:Zn-dependent membrane protease YugP
MFYSYDPLYFLFLLPGLLLSIVAAYLTKSTFSYYGQKPTGSCYTGADIAKAILRDNGISTVRVEQVQGHLTDHYDPQAKVLRLSPRVFNGSSMAAFGVAAHEVGHAIQDKENYPALRFRSQIVPLVNFGSPFGVLAIAVAMGLGGFATAGGTILAWVGLGLFSLGSLFALITLPVEFDASSRALLALKRGSYVQEKELAGAKKVLNAAALTYVASAVSALLMLLYYAVRLGLFNNRDD